MLNHNEILRDGGLDNYANYGGEVMPDNWLCLMGRNRDSDLLTQSNWECAIKQLGGESEHVAIIRIRHWACGWIEYMFINSDDNTILSIAEDIEATLSDYLILDESDFFERETKAANDFWENCFTPKERIEYIREFRDQFYFYDWQAIREVVRGEYFNGYVSELIY